MGAVENAIDSAAKFIGPFIDKSRHENEKGQGISNPSELIQQVLSHLQAINTADLAADPDAPYDASLAGVVYGLLDFITAFGILPHLSPGVAFSQRPRSVLTVVIPAHLKRDVQQLSVVINTLLPLLNQKGSGVQPLVSQRILPDIIAALAELSFFPINQDKNAIFTPVFQRIIEETPTSRLLPILTTFLQQPLPEWLKPVVSKHLTIIPLRHRGIRHLLEFLSLSFLANHSQTPGNVSGTESQIPIPLEAISQASRLLVLPPPGMSQDQWLCQLAPQLWEMLDGSEGTELSRAAGQIIAGGILSKRTTGAPGMVGWELFARPLIQNLYPLDFKNDPPQQRVAPNQIERVLVKEQGLESALSRLNAIALSYSHAGLLKRLVGPVLLPMWALLNYAQANPALHKKWALLSESIILRYMSVACDLKDISKIITDIFWDGDTAWIFGPGSQGGVEIRRRSTENYSSPDMSNILGRISSISTRVNLFVSLLANTSLADDVVGSIFLRVTQRWLSPVQESKKFLTDEPEIDPLAALVNAKLSEAMATSFRDHFVRSPQHIMELMRQLLSNIASEHQNMVKKLAGRSNPTRANLRNLVATEKYNSMGEDTNYETTNEDIASFAISILSTLVSSSNFKQTPATQTIVDAVLAPLVYLSQEQPQRPFPPLIQSSAKTLLRLLQPSSTSTSPDTSDPLAEHRTTLKSIIANLASSEPPDRTWALTILRTFIKDREGFQVIDVPSMTHLLLSASLADPESYVHIAAVPVLVDLAICAPNPVVQILVDAFIDIDEQSMKSVKENRTEEKAKAVQQALDFRLRIGEVLNKFMLDESYDFVQNSRSLRSKCQRQISDACLSLSSRRGKRTQTLSTRTQIGNAERELQKDGEAAWGGPIPNLLDPEGGNLQDQAERDALLAIIQGWEDTGIEEDVRIRMSALSVLSTTLEHQLALLQQVTINAALQIALLVLTMETSAAKGILRRAAMLVIIGLLRGLNDALESNKGAAIELGMPQQEEVERVVEWVRDEDVDALVREHATSALGGLKSLRLRKMYKHQDERIGLSANLGLEGGLRGLDLKAHVIGEGQGPGEGQRKKLIVEEVD
ncbi:hypothetical protein GQ44DRAFT_643637 [Phaeosphaeriaceae sp. PMI808]|nr:hypothetical protein GQ44DRAFT_643637 [Phaeosphaeriaceae sp. PMI808]